MNKKEIDKAIRIATREYDEAWGAVYNAEEGNCLHAAALDGILKAMDDLDLWRKRRDIVQVTPKKQLKALKLVRDKALKRLEALQAQEMAVVRKKGSTRRRRVRQMKAVKAKEKK